MRNKQGWWNYCLETAFGSQHIHYDFIMISLYILTKVKVSLAWEFSHTKTEAHVDVWPAAWIKTALKSHSKWNQASFEAIPSQALSLNVVFLVSMYAKVFINIHSTNRNNNWMKYFHFCSTQLHRYTVLLKLVLFHNAVVLWKAFQEEWIGQSLIKEVVGGIEDLIDWTLTAHRYKTKSPESSETTGWELFHFRVTTRSINVSDWPLATGTVT